MKRRRTIPATYTVMITRSGKDPMLFSVSAIAVWLSIGAFVAVILLSFLLGWLQGQASGKRNTAYTLPARSSTIP